MRQITSLSIFFPSLNDAQSLPYMVTRAYEAARSITHNFEIIIIDDGSTDDTLRVVSELRRHYRHLRLVTHPKNRGYGGALISGFTAAKKEWVFYTDGDGQYDPSELTLLINKASSRTDVVNGYKEKRHDPLMRIIAGSIYNWFIRIIYHPPIRDIDCDFRLIRRSLLKRLDLTSQSGAICLELVTKLHHRGARFREVAVHHYPRLFGRSQFFSLRRIAKTIEQLPPVTHHMY